ncbi:hypothetical protein Tco_0151843 [Tanacetum coccineum]
MRSFIPSAVLTREGLKSTARPRKTQTVPSKSTANVFYQGAIQMKISRIMILLTVDCSGSMTGDKDKLSDFKAFKGGYVAFGNDPKGGRITGKGTIKTSFIDFEKVSYVEELKFNLLSVSQICDKKHNVLFTDKECLILSPKFKFVDEDLVILRAPRKNDVYSLDLKNIIPSGGDETYDMLHDLIVGLEKWLSIKVKTSGVTMETEFKNQFMNEFCAMKGIKREYSIARTLSKVTRHVQDCLHVDFLENQENQKGKGPDWMFDLDLLTSSMNYITVKKENYADSGSKGSTYDDIEDQDDQQFIVHVPSINAAQNTHSEERTANKDVPLSYEEQALHDELVSLMHQESLARSHNDAQRNTFEEDKRRIALKREKEVSTIL